MPGLRKRYPTEHNAPVCRPRHGACLAQCERAARQNAKPAGAIHSTCNGQLGRAYRGGLRHWVIYGTIIATILTGVIVWAGWRFFTADDVQGLVYWGVIALAALHAQVAMKLWIFMEMNRTSTVRETKRLEVALARLEERLEIQNGR